MKQEVMLSHWQDYPQEDGMLFVRTRGILTTMARAPLIALGLFFVVITIPSQTSFGLTKHLELIIYPDGSTHVSTEYSVDPLEPDFTVELFGTEIDNFVAEDEDGFLLSGTIEGNNVVVETLGSSTISVDYDTHDLVSKSGRIWTFSVDSPIDYKLLMPKNTVIVGMSNYPLSMQVINDQSELVLPSGPLEINYFFGVTPSSPPQNPPVENNPQTDNTLFYIAGVSVAAIAGAVLVVKRTKKVKKPNVRTATPKEPVDPETIFKLKPDLREDDKELINFIVSNGGQAFESELRKKFLQPRTTMWRAVKRLERHGIIEIEKKELQNLVKLKKNLEDEQ